MKLRLLDYSQLSELLMDFYTLTRIRISFWNSDGEKCLMAPNNGDSPFCRELRKNPCIEELCRSCDAAALRNIDSYQNTLYQFLCPAGMKEYVMPAFYNGELLGFFMYGQVRNPASDENGAMARDALCRQYQLDKAYMEVLYSQLPYVDEQQMHVAGHILAALVGYAHLNGLVWSREIPLEQRVEHYVKAHYMDPVDIDTVCRALHVSRSTLSHTLQKKLGMSFVALLKRCRIESVRKCLDGGLSITDATYRSGFQSINYMSRVFQEIVGIRPTEYINARNRK